jgi:hypothetical protein
MKQIVIDGVQYVINQKIGPLVIVRTYAAGVHIGILGERNGTEATLHNAVRLWRWRGANTLNEVATKGVNRDEYTRISEPVPEIILTQVIEIIPVLDGLNFSPVWND